MISSWKKALDLWKRLCERCVEGVVAGASLRRGGESGGVRRAARGISCVQVFMFSRVVDVERVERRIPLWCSANSRALDLKV